MANSYSEMQPTLLEATNGASHDSSVSAPAFNKGASVKDVEAIGPDQEAQDAWRARIGIDKSKQVRLVKLAHMRYRHPDLEEITTFMRDFGMTVAKKMEDKVWFKGYGEDQYVYYAEKGPKTFLGGTFTVESYSDLEKAQKLNDNAEIQKIEDAPGGGYLLTLTDPEGFPFNLMYGQEPAARSDVPENLVINSEREKPRKREFQRFTPGPAAVHKLGHYGLCVQNFEAQTQFYLHNFNFVPTDYLHIPHPDPSKPSQNMDVAAFCHIDRGQDLTDHHCFLLTTTRKESKVHHCSFEVHDFDTQNLGHQWLAAKGYKSVWGVGRHILGSQIFDYWWDTTGFMVEHYADGDVVNEETPVGHMAAGDESLAVWGPAVPKGFVD